MPDVPIWRSGTPGKPMCRATGCPATAVVGRHPEHSEGEVTYMAPVHLPPSQQDAREASGLPRGLAIEVTLEQYPPVSANLQD